MILKPPPLGVGSAARVTFWDENGNRVPAYTPDGQEIWGGEWHPNMITDAGLDGLAARNNLSGDGIRTYLRLDTGMPEIKDKSGGITASQSGNTITASAAFFGASDVGRAIVFEDSSNARITAFVSATEVTVDKSQTVPAQEFERWHVERSSLVNGILPSNSTGGFSSVVDDAVTDTDFLAARTVTRICTFVSAENVTGYGFSQTNNDAITIMDRFRGPAGEPITLSMLAGKSIRVDHTLQLRISHTPTVHTVQIDQYDAANNLVDSTPTEVDAWAFLQQASGTPLNLIRNWVAPNFALDSNTASGSGLLSDAEQVMSPRGSPATVISDKPMEVTSPFVKSEYVGGSRRRTLSIVHIEAHSNGVAYGWAVGRTNTNGVGVFEGFAFKFRDGFSLVKDANHTLRVGYEISWDRDYQDYG